MVVAETVILNEFIFSDMLYTILVLLLNGFAIGALLYFERFLSKTGKIPVYVILFFIAASVAFADIMVHILADEKILSSGLSIPLHIFDHTVSSLLFIGALYLWWKIRSTK